MKTTDTAKAWEILVERNVARKENRTAFIAALILDLCGPMLPSEAEAYAVELVRLADLIKAEAEAACSYERTPAQEAADDRNQRRFLAIAEALGFEARTGGDPRGACAYLIDPDDPARGDWSEGWAVYR